MNTKQILLILATVTTALVAGLFFGFVVAINPAFARLPDAAYITAMQEINIAIINPAFIFCFVGAGIFLPLAALKQPRKSRQRSLLWLAAILYIIGVLGITSSINVPLNDILAKFQVTGSSAEQAAQARAAFADKWNNWHLVRTLANIAATVLAIMACFPGAASKQA